MKLRGAATSLGRFCARPCAKGRCSTSEPEPIREARRWPRFAHEDLIAGEALLGQRNVAPRTGCWFAQQAVEKALKAALILIQREFPRRHDLDVLRDLLPDGWRVKAVWPDLTALTEWAVEARYPGEQPEATAENARNALGQARAIVTLMIEDFAAKGVEAST